MPNQDLERPRIRWGILGTGAIASVLAEAIQASRTGDLRAVGSRSADRAKSFAERFDIPTTYDSYNAVLEDPDVDAVYVALPHTMHVAWTVRALEAGKHVLCEKPLAADAPHAMAMIEAAKEQGRVVIEAYMYRWHPQTTRVLELVRDGAIGTVRLVEATCSFRATPDRKPRLFDPDLGGGAILDVGGYCVTFAGLVAGARRGSMRVQQPASLVATANFDDDSGVDVLSVAAADYGDGLLARLTTGISLTQDNAVRIFGTDGSILVANPWKPGATSTIVVHRPEGSDAVEVSCADSLYALQVDGLAECVAAGDVGAAAFDWEDSLATMRTLDTWQRAIRPATATAPRPVPAPLRGALLQRRGEVPAANVAGIERTLSRLVMGADSAADPMQTAVMFDDYIERGGNCFDTAWVYDNGGWERTFGIWLADRGLRDEIVLIGKGAQTPFCFSETVGRHLGESLERLQTDHVEIYMMHRDNPEVPVGEFVEALAELQHKGLALVTGVSNWRVDRIEAANDYAAAHSLPGIGVVSNQFSLARMLEPAWAGCVTASDDESRAFFTRTGTPLFAWSSQSAGFFAGGLAGVNPKQVHCWVDDANLERLARATRLAEERGVTPINIALAYVLAQPFPTFPIMGPRTTGETRAALRAFEVELDPAELDWLDLATDRKPGAA